VKCFVIARDRVTYARQCVDALWAVGLDVIVVDHGSTWLPAVRWLDTIDEQANTQGGFPQVIWSDNRHPRDLWRERDSDRPGLLGPIRAYVKPDERFIVTDCDVIPDPDCPANWPDRMFKLLDRYPAIRKVGLGLRTDDIPDHFAHRDMVQQWEAQYQAAEDGGRLGPMATDNGAVIADIDTTLAMYRRFEPFTLGPAVRLRPPYVARHLPWYEDVSALDEEQQYYRNHAVYGHWRDPHTYADDYGLRDGS
jgi:hypothetical protein